MVIEMIEKALIKGCGVSLKEALESKRYGELFEEQKKLFEEYPEDTDEGVALRKGHLQAGKLLNILPEEKAIKEAKLSPNVSSGIELRALIRLLGEYLVKASEACLPESVVKMAMEWKKAKAERQIEISKEVYHIFCSNDQRKKREANFTTLPEIIASDIAHNYSDSGVVGEEFLPRIYGKWNQDNCKANCLGKEQMLTAFGRLAGCNIVSVGPIIQAKDILEQWRMEAANMALNDIAKRNIQPDEGFIESIMASRKLQFLDKIKPKNFHGCVTLQIRDGSWVMVDSHSLNWGIFPDNWKIDHIWQMLSKYRKALPGLSVIGHDQGNSEVIRLKELQKASLLFERSRRLEEAMGEESVINLIGALTKSDDLELILIDLLKVNPEKVATVLKEPSIRHYYASMLVTGEEFPDSVDFILMNEDKELSREKIGSLLTVFHCLAIDAINDQLNESGKFLSPVCEFSLPEYRIAISVINSLNCDIGTLSQDFFLDYEFSQLVLCNALVESFPKQNRQNKPELAQVAAGVLRELPFLHSRCKMLLEMIRR